MNVFVSHCYIVTLVGLLLVEGIPSSVEHKEFQCVKV
jgi:hypothetical protein